jgi:hypothetical protein
MPIRFRCTKCDGLLSIARRKAGLSIKCPKCQTEVTVPDASTDLAAGEGEIENDDVEQIYEPKPGQPIAKDAALKLEQPQLIGNVNPLNSSALSTAPDVPVETGIYLTPQTVGILAVLFVVLLALSFATGYLIAG